MGCPYAINTTMFTGFKTYLDFFIRILDEKYVGKRLVKEFIAKKEVCFMYLYESLIFRLLSLLPTEVMDFISIHLDVSNFASLLASKNKAS